MIQRRIIRVAATAVLAIGLAGAFAAPASAHSAAAPAVTASAVVHPDVNHTVCANSLTLRPSPGSGTVLGTMFYGQQFYYDHSNGAGWDYGYSYDIGQWGWVVSGYFC